MVVKVVYAVRVYLCGHAKARADESPCVVVVFPTGFLDFCWEALHKGEVNFVGIVVVYFLRQLKRR